MKKFALSIAATITVFTVLGGCTYAPKDESPATASSAPPVTIVINGTTLGTTEFEAHGVRFSHDSNPFESESPTFPGACPVVASDGCEGASESPVTVNNYMTCDGSKKRATKQTPKAPPKAPKGSCPEVTASY